MKKIFNALSKAFLLLVIVSLISCGNKESNIATNESKKSEDVNTIADATEVNESSSDDNLNSEPKEVHRVIDPMEVVNVGGYRNDDVNNYIEIEFSKEVRDGFDGSSYIKLEPDEAFTVSKVGKKLILNGNFVSGKEYKLTLLSGIKANDNTAIEEDKTYDVAFAIKKPRLAFVNSGIILPSVTDKKIYVRSLNVNKINIIVRKVYANNLTQFLQKFSFSGNGTYRGSFYQKTDDNEYEDDNYYYYDDSSFYDVGDEIFNSKFDIENEVDNWVQTAIDLTGILDANGVYIVDVKFDKDGTNYKFKLDKEGNLEWSDYYYISQNGTIRKTVLLTNMGIVAEKSNDGIKVNILDIVDNRFLRGIKVYLMSKNNQVLEEKTTDADGVVDFGNHKNAFYILADDRLSKSVLPLKNALGTNGFAVDGVNATSGIKGYLYTERGVYRPGDTIYLSIIARNNDEPLVTNQPIVITVYDPTGVKMIDKDVVKDGKDGFYTYSFKTDLSSRTGIWKLEAKIGDVVLKKDISVETVVPNKIRVNLNIPDVVDMNSEIKDWTITSNYLFGEPAGNNDYYVSFAITEEPVNFEKYKDYTFTAPSTYRYSEYETVRGKLDDYGVGLLEPDFSDVKFSSLNMLVDVDGQVQPEGGRPTTSKKFIKLKKFDTYVGLENVDTYKKPGESLNIKAICVSEDGENLVAGKNLKYRIYSNNQYWWLDYPDYNSFVRSFKSDKNTELLYEGDIVSADVPVVLDYIIPNKEYLYVEIEDVATSQIAGVNIEASEWVDPSVTKKIETLNVGVDKKSYNVGDVAELRFKGSPKSKAIITIEKAGKIINQIYKDVNDGEMVENINITKEMAPNAYAYVTLIQDYNTKENDRPLRLYGIVPLNVVDEDTKIDLEISAPNEVRPNEKFVVKVKNKKNKQVDFTVAVVDEGLLDITAFKTPSPWDYFFQKIATKLKLYDNYSEIIDRPYGAIHQVLKVGGDESLLDEMARRRRLKQLGLEEADRFTPVSMFKGVLSTDVNGDASIDFDMPNYMGQVRIMVIAANGNSFGSAEKDMLVKAPIIVDPTLPRSMKVGDKLSIPVSIFALEDNIGNIEVNYTFRGETRTKNVNLAKGGKEIVYFEEEIGNEIGNEKLTIGVKSNVYSYEETVGMAINSNNTPIEESINKELNGREEATFTLDKEYVKGTVDRIITISNVKLLGLDQRLKYLIKYPYGCAEQTTSSVFPQLFIDKLSTTRNYEKEKVVDNINSGISRLQLFQLSNGSFSYWPGENYTSDYATNYIGHFLTLAKKNGYYIPETMFNNWLSYTKAQVRKTQSEDSEFSLSWKCYALYLLALNGNENLSEMNYLYENHFNKNMTLTSKMYLAAAYKLAGEETRAKSIASAINVGSIKKMFDEIYARDRNYYDVSFGSKLREIAVYLDCYYTIYGKMDDEAFDEIVSALRLKNWYSTQTTAYSLVAISNVLGDNKEDIIKGTIEIDGNKTEYSTDSVKRILVDGNAKTIKIIPDVDGKTYVNYYLEAVPVNNDVEDYAEGFDIERHYYDDEGNKVDATNVKAGTSFWLEVVVTPTKRGIERLNNIALTQILPSGFEIENTRLTGENLPKWVVTENLLEYVGTRYTDIRDDRIMWFFNYSGSHKYRFFVKLNAVTKGEYDFPGTVLEAMYDNDYRAYKKGKRVKVN